MLPLPLDKIDLLDTLSPEEQQFFQRFFVRDGHSILTYTPNASIIQKDQENDNLYIIVSGTVIVNVAHRRITLETGHSFGEINFFAKGGRTATINAGPAGAIVLIITRKLFDIYMLNRPAAAQIIIENFDSLIAERLAQITQFLRDEHDKLNQIIPTVEADIQNKAFIGQLSQILLKDTIALLSGFTAEEIEHVNSIFPIKKIEPNKQFIQQGDRSNELLHVVAGTAVVEDIARLNIGQSLGDIAFITGLPRTANVFAGPAGLEVRIFTPDTFRKFAEFLPSTAGKIRLNLAEILATRFRATLEIVDGYQEKIHEVETQEEEPRTFTSRLLRALTKPIKLNR